MRIGGPTLLSHTWLHNPTLLKRELSSTMVRKLKYHEQKLLKKVDFLNVCPPVSLLDPILIFPVETRCKPPRNQGHAPLPHPGQRGLPQVFLFSSLLPHPLLLFPLLRYNKLCGSLRSFAHRISLLPAQDPYRSRMEAQVLSKLYDMGVLNTSAKLSDIENKLTVSAFCRRRLAVFMCMSKMSETVSAVITFFFFLLVSKKSFVKHSIQAVKFIEQGHVRVGPDTITDPAFLVTR